MRWGARERVQFKIDSQGRYIKKETLGKKLEGSEGVTHSGKKRIRQKEIARGRTICNV